MSSTRPTSQASRRQFLSMIALAPVAGYALSACGTSGPGGSGSGGDAVATEWYLSGEPSETITTNAVNAFNEANPDKKIGLTFFQNDAYKTKIKTAIGAGQAPTIIYGWGGGTLASYVAAGQVDDLTGWFDQNAAVKDRLFPSSFGPATVDGKLYALPNETVTPIVMYYNEDLFQQVGAEKPTTWDELLALVPVFRDAGVAPLSLGGQSRWTSMMWLEYLFDRIGGAEVFQNIAAGQPDAWSVPAAVDSLTKIQDLVRAGGFVDGFESVTADSNADQALLYTGRAAMMLHGAWCYGAMKNDAPDFVTGGKLGFGAFPTVEGGTGDPSNAVGNPGQYMSIFSRASQEAKDAALAYFADGIMTDDVIQAYIDNGQVPIVTGIEDKLASSEDPEWLDFIFQLASKAAVFTQSWDQALSPSTAEALLTNIEQLFALSIDPQTFITNMNATLGQ
ncbi:extracellular solute-binding protein [Quadrisphaera sp. KR29]|uniref:extracellular solute-binding protein n=1 Tax=Quadrisphaera sp. KR29 TaxID=3461391 RepID=UPI004044795E